ncbi:MAG TPA: flagellar export protein FliJ [Pseudomonas sp.]|jgi:flagellar FliJ protein|uniref:flagellar export protein FliJ n=1 Tax=Pseudomonas sp. TaxID=306 RepID=UPI002ED7EF33
MADQSFDLLIELAGKERDLAARELAQGRKTEQQILTQLQTLDQYHQEYRQNLQVELHKEGMSPSTLANYRGFLNSLEAAVDRTRKSLERQRKQVAQQQLSWMVKWRKVNALEALVSRRAQDKQLQVGRMEQRQTDEMATQLRRQAANFSSSIDRRF